MKRELNAIKGLYTANGNYETYYEALESIDAIIYDYPEYATERPVNVTKELTRLSNADFKLCCAIFTMILREDRFSEGSFKRRYKEGSINKILDRMVWLLENN